MIHALLHDVGTDAGRGSSLICMAGASWPMYINRSKAKPAFNTKSTIPSCRDRALLVSGSGQTGHIDGLARPQHPLPTTTDPYQPPPTSTGQPQPFQSLSNPHLQLLQAFLYVRFRWFRGFCSRRFSTEC
jgi:hypothetical protein